MVGLEPIDEEGLPELLLLLLLMPPVLDEVEGARVGVTCWLFESSFSFCWTCCCELLLSPDEPSALSLVLPVEVEESSSFCCTCWAGDSVVVVVVGTRDGLFGLDDPLLLLFALLLLLPLLADPFGRPLVGLRLPPFGRCC